MVKFQNGTWSISITRNFFFFHNCLDSIQYSYLRKYGLPRKEPIVVSKNGKLGFVFNEKKMLENYNKSVENICLSPTKFKKIEKLYYKVGKKLSIASSKLENKITRKTYEDFLEAYRNLAPGLFLTSTIGRHMSELLIDRLKKSYPLTSKSEIDILVSKITYPRKHTPLFESQLLLLEIGARLQEKKLIAKDIKTDPKIYKKFRDYVSEYSVIPVNFNEEPWTEEEILKQLGNLMKENCRTEIKKILEQHEKRIRESKDLLAKIKNKEIGTIVNSLRVGTLLNEYRKFIYCRASLAYRPLLKMIAKKYNISDWQECGKLTPYEVASLYFDKKEEILGVLPERDWVGAMAAKNKNGYRLLSEKELALFISEIKSITPSKNEKSDVQEISGMIANPGIIRGTAKIIMGKADFHKFKDNDVIVTAMTSVDFVPIMKRASAFVTNEGGITSHASIVSRELNKPSIIGTKIATKVLKDGDIVEVDANNGIVKIIKKTK